MPTNTTTIVTMPSEFVRAVTAVDPDGSAVAGEPAFPCNSVRLAAWSDTPGASLSMTLIFRGSSGQVVGSSSIQFTAPQTSNYGATYLATPSYDPCWPLAGARSVVPKVDVITAGSWTISGAMA